MAATILSANRSNVLVNGQALEGLQEITYQTVRNHENIAAIGQAERVGVVFGPTHVVGTMRVRSSSQSLEDLLKNQAPFQIFASLKHGQAEAETVKEISLDEVYLHGKSFALAAGGVVETIYHFTATRER
ncbi:MAG TPA: hypothetical protein VNT75_02685 [Symbiobacteriaceae bacterium]|nr:hypothetical protein [Symbiobacteriaceae bacterium]